MNQGTIVKKKEGRAAVVANNKFDSTKAYVKKTVPKDDGQKKLIISSITNNILFKTCKGKEFGDIVDAFEEVTVKELAYVINQGEKVRSLLWSFLYGRFLFLFWRRERGDFHVLFSNVSDPSALSFLCLFLTHSRFVSPPPPPSSHVFSPLVFLSLPPLLSSFSSSSLFLSLRRF